jgi:Domain of unknown function (DUF6883)
MKLPNRENAVVEDEKILDYLISEAHPIGRFKAKVFRRLGFDETNVDLFRKCLKSIANAEEIISTRNTKHGVKYGVVGLLSGPTGQTMVLTVWIIENDTEIPRLVTAYPDSE